eukprot:6801697-Lingulodinium_polyedra.AAC.1
MVFLAARAILPRGAMRRGALPPRRTGGPRNPTAPGTGQQHTWQTHPPTCAHANRRWRGGR